MKVLVVGGAGYLGGAVTDCLLHSQHEFRVYDALLYEESYRKPVDFVYGDVRDWNTLKPHLQWADAVIWLAALVGDAACQLNPEISVAINEEPVFWLGKHFKGRILFTSTCSVYGAQCGTVLTEESSTDPLSIYAATKLAAERHLAGCNALIFRLGTLYGVGDQFSRIRLDLVVNTLTVRAYRLGKITVNGGNQFRPLLHVRDAARMMVDSLVGSHVGIFNLLNQNVRILDLAYQVRNHFPDVAIEQTDMPLQDRRDYRVSNQKARTLLGFKARHTIDDAIEDMRVLLEGHRFPYLDSPRYANHLFLSTYNTHTRIAKRVAVHTEAPAAAGGNGDARASHSLEIHAAA